MNRRPTAFSSFLILTAGLGLLVLATPAVAGPTATASGTSVEFAAGPSVGSFTLRIMGPSGELIRDQTVASGAASLSLFRANGAALADGTYNWEMRSVATTARTRGGSDTEAATDDSAWVSSGSFTVRDGAFVAEGAAEERAAAPRVERAAGGPQIATLDQVIADDLIVQGSICAGFDCVNNESFGFDTIRMKENNTRVKFEDTSVGTFPSTDWQLTANDSASGGANRFSIEDITAARVPFTVTGGAATNSIFVDSTGRVGFRTSTPVLDLHVNTSNTPALRLEQNSSGGFTAQTWDVAGNEANFFVRDVTGGSRLPFRIRPGAPTSSVDISASGDVGIGTASPSVKLHVTGSDGSNSIVVEETNATTALRNMFTMRNNGGIQLLYDRTDGASNDWQMSNFSASFQISVPGSATAQFNLQANGNLTIGGTLTELSSRTYKENFVPVDGREILRKLSNMPLSSWSRISDPSQRHLGPFAEDWFATFGLGPGDKQIGIADLSGVALAAIQGLNAELEEKEQALSAQEVRLQALERLNENLIERLVRLEAERAAAQP